MGEQGVMLDEGLRAKLRAIAIGRRNAEGWSEMPRQLALNDAITLRSLGMIETLPVLTRIAMVRLTPEGRAEIAATQGARRC